MLRYVLRRLMTAIPTLFVIVTISFFLMRVAPGGPFNQEKGLNPVIKANLERVFGLDLPLWKQYLNYLLDLSRGNLGTSLRSTGTPVSRKALKSSYDLSGPLQAGAPAVYAMKRAVCSCTGTAWSSWR